MSHDNSIGVVVIISLLEPENLIDSVVIHIYTILVHTKGSDVIKTSFEWDAGNDVKSYTKHGVSNLEAESLFSDPERLDFIDPTHSHIENRYISVGSSNRARVLFSAWTLRGNKVRIISVRPASKNERSVYEEKNKKRRR